MMMAQSRDDRMVMSGEPAHHSDRSMMRYLVGRTYTSSKNMKRYLDNLGKIHGTYQIE